VVVTGSDGNIASGFIPALSTLNLASSSVTMTAGATINGATLPVPVYASTTDDRVYAMDGDNPDTHVLLGYAVSNSTAGNSITVQTSGLVSGYSTLEPGVIYYIQDSAGTIASTTGTYEIPVGLSVSSSTIAIQRDKLFRTGAISIDGTANNTTVTLPWYPATIRFRGMAENGADDFGILNGSFQKGAGTTCTYMVVEPTGTGASLGTGCLLLSSAGSYMTLTITASSTGFTLSEAETGTFENGILYWEAESGL
jgi:hypothetical protein